MAAWARWSVHCTTLAEDMAVDCWHWAYEEATQGAAQKLARQAGWEVGKLSDAPNLCPACIKLRDGK